MKGDSTTSEGATPPPRESRTGFQIRKKDNTKIRQQYKLTNCLTGQDNLHHLSRHPVGLQTKSNGHISKCGNSHHSLTMLFNGGFIMDTKEKAKKAPSKKELLKDIITLDDRFESGSLSRTNVANLVILKSLLTS